MYPLHFHAFYIKWGAIRMAPDDEEKRWKSRGFAQNIGIENLWRITMLENIPSQVTMTELLGQSLFAVWEELCSAIDEKYEMERLWNTGGKKWTYEYK